MAEPIKISTGEFNKQGKVNIDGKLWDVKLPGAGTEMRLSQAFRNSKIYAARIELLDKRIDDGSATEQDLDSYEDYNKKFSETEQFILDFFTSIFRDGTEDNSEVKKWVNETPTAIIEMAFSSVTAQANGEGTDGQEKPSGSAQ